MNGSDHPSQVGCLMRVVVVIVVVVTVVVVTVVVVVVVAVVVVEIVVVVVVVAVVVVVVAVVVVLVEASHIASTYKRSVLSGVHLLPSISLKEKWLAVKKHSVLPTHASSTRLVKQFLLPN